MSASSLQVPSGLPARPLHRDVVQQHVRDIFSLLLVFRLINACIVFTFFQPDEYFQALEPAWTISFGDVGKERGAWLTWEWQHALRSSLLPYAISLLYALGRALSTVAVLPHPVRAQLYILLPSLFTGALTAVGEYATWQLAENVYGTGSSEGWAVVLMSLANPWLFFTGTRTLSNTIEAALTAVALMFWPWAMVSRQTEPHMRQAALKKWKYSIILAGIACILRPTNALVWFPITLWTLTAVSISELTVFVLDAGIYGGAVLAVTSALDYRFYGRAVFPPYEWLRYNLQQNLAVFYGANRVDYYATEGLPLILTTLLPFALVGIWRGARSSPSAPAGSGDMKADGPSTNAQSNAHFILRSCTAAVGFTLTALTAISHKEARFLSPLLPMLHLLAARPLVSFIPDFSRRKAILGLTLTINFSLAIYITQIHQSGPLTLVKHLRQLHQDRNHEAISFGGKGEQRDMTVAFLMPCHSTPWRSHLYYEGIRAWALTCEPPVNLSKEERDVYVDEADEFYTDPIAWLDMELESTDFLRPWMVRTSKDVDGRKQWPQYLAMFDSLITRGAGARSGSDIKTYLELKGYEECWRAFSSHLHDDGRRWGDVVLWCVPEDSNDEGL